MSVECPKCRAPFPPIGSVHEIQIMELAQFVEQGEPITAIKKLREITHVGLKEAKDYIDCPHRALQPQPAPVATGITMKCPTCTRKLPPIAGASPDQMQIIGGHMVAGRKIEAIKEVRAASGLGLKEARDFVECPHDGSSAKKGCAGAILALAASVAGLLAIL